MVRPVVSLDGSELGMAWSKARPEEPGSGGSTRAMPGSRSAAATAAEASRCGATIWSAPGAPAPNACCSCA